MGPTKDSPESSHSFQPPEPSASRSPCPALNTLANHDYIPRDGRDVNVSQLKEALQHPNTYNLSPELTELLVVGGLALMHEAPFSSITLHDLARHGYIEHDASLVHKNTPTGKEFAPVECDPTLLEALLGGSDFLTMDAVARRRVLVEQACKGTVTALHKELARGEWALVMDVFGRKLGGKVPADFLRVWLSENRLPQTWQATHEQGLAETVKYSASLHFRMHEYRRELESAVSNGGAADEITEAARELAGSPEDPAKSGKRERDESPMSPSQKRYKR